MSNLKSRIDAIEKKLNPHHEPRIFVTIYGPDGRVQYGSNELIGMARKQVAVYLGENVTTKRVGIDLSKI